MAFEWPAETPADEAPFVTGPKSSDAVEAKLVAMRLNQSTRGKPQVEMAYRVCAGQVATLRDGIRPEDVGDRICISARSLSGGAAPITFEDLKATGFSVGRAVESYKDDAEAKSIRQQLASRMAGADPNLVREKGDEAVAMLAIRRGDLDACGAGRENVRLVCGEETFNDVTRVRVKYVNPIPREIDASGLLDLVAGFGAGVVSGKKPPGQATQRKGAGTSPPPKEIDNDVDF